MSDQKDVSRRRFHLASIYGLVGAIGAALGFPAVAYLLIPSKSKKKTGWTEAADLAQLPVGVPQEVVFRRKRVDGWRVVNEKATAWVLKKADQQAIAFAPQCTHLGCAYHWDAANHNFLCPCHTSTFSIDGKVLTGPAPRPLDRYAVKIEGTRLLVGKISESGGAGPGSAV